MSQTDKDFEWVLIDGGSQKGDRNFLEQHASEMVWWCREPDSGGGDNAQNKGIAHARGGWDIYEFRR